MKCVRCKHYTGWYGKISGYCVEIFKHIGVSDDDQEKLVYAEVKESFTCGAWKLREEK